MACDTLLMPPSGLCVAFQCLRQPKGCGPLAALITVCVCADERAEFIAESSKLARSDIGMARARCP